MTRAISDEAGLTVQETAERTGLSVHTLRYYEREGLLSPIRRDAGSGHRRYTQEDLTRIYFLQKMRATGMPIPVMQRYVQLFQDGDDTLTERRQLLEAHREHVQAQLAELNDCLALIDYKIANYQQLEQQHRSATEEEIFDCQKMVSATPPTKGSAS